MIDGGIGQTLRQCLNNSLLEGVVLGQMLSEANAKVVVFTLETRQESLVSDGKTKILGGIKLKCVVNIKKLKVFFILDIIIKSLKGVSIELVERCLECFSVIKLKSTQRPQGIDLVLESQSRCL